MNTFSACLGAVLARPFRFLFIGVWLALGLVPAWASGRAGGPPVAAAAPALAGALAADGTLRPGVAGSFDAKGFEMFTAADGKPVFRPAGAHGTAGAGDENWRNGFVLPDTNGSVEVLAVTANGDVYIAGTFTSAGGLAANRVAKWDGTVWSVLGSGLNQVVYALAVVGTDVYVGGYFTAAGTVPVSGIAKWDGRAWGPVGAGVNGSVYALLVVGTDLYVGGNFTQAGGAAANGVAKWVVLFL